MQANRKHSWMFGWAPPWHRKEGDINQHSSTAGHQRRRQQNQSSKVATFDNDQIHYPYNNNTNESFPSSRQTDRTADTGSPLSSSNSSFTSSLRRSTKGSVLDFFHRRKSSTPSSVMSTLPASQQSSMVGPLCGRNASIPTSSSAIALSNGSPQPHSTLQSTSPTNALPTSSIIMNNSHHQAASPHSITSPPLVPAAAVAAAATATVTSTSSSSSIHQHHRFPFGGHHSETANAPSTIPEEHHSPSYPHRTSPPHNSTTSTIGLRPYDTLIHKAGPFYEQSMEDSAPPSMDDTKRITLRHDLVKLALDGLFKSPLDPHQEGERQVLQIGCGNGAWCVDFAKEHPKWFVVGLDDRYGGPLISAASSKKMMMSGTSLSSSTASSLLLPAGQAANGCNFTFIRSTTTLVDSLKMFPDGHFDLIYGRFLALALPPSDYEDLISECWRVCKPGGFVEFTELDMRIYGTQGSGTLVKKLNQQVVSAMKKQKLDPRLPRHLQDLFFKLLVDDQPASSRQRQNSYQVKYNSLPLGVWGGRLGVMFRDDIHDVLDALNVTTTSTNTTTTTTSSIVPDELHDEDDDDDLDEEDEPDDLGNRSTPFEEDWTTTTDLLDDELDSQMAFMNIYQIFAQKHKE